MNVGEATGNQAPPAIVNQESYSKTCVIVGIAIGSLAFSAGLLSILASKGVPLGVFNTLGNLNQIYAIGLMTFGGLTLGSVAVSKLRNPVHQIPSNTNTKEEVESVTPSGDEEVKSPKEKDNKDSVDPTDVGASQKKSSSETITPLSSEKLPSEEYISFSLEFVNHSELEHASVRREVALLRSLLDPLNATDVVTFSGANHPQRPYYALFFKIDDSIQIMIYNNAQEASSFPIQGQGKQMMRFDNKSSVIKKDEIMNDLRQSPKSLCKIFVNEPLEFTWICIHRKDPSSNTSKTTFEIFSNHDPLLQSKIDGLKKEGIQIIEEKKNFVF